MKTFDNGMLKLIISGQVRRLEPRVTYRVFTEVLVGT